MEIKILGSGAGDGIPAPFCNCRICENARKNKGKDFRTRCCIVVNKNIMIDFSQDIFYQNYINNIRLFELKGVFISHSHFDHLAPEELCLRYSWYCNMPENNPLKIYCNNKSKDLLVNFSKFDNGNFPNFLNINILEYFKKVEIEGLTITPLPSNHVQDENGFLFFIESKTKSFLYCTDSAFPPRETIEYLKDKYLDLILFDSTYGGSRYSGKTHMGFGANRNLKDILVDYKVIDIRTRLITFHFSHHCNSTHSELLDIAKEYGFEVGYDSMEIRL
jgi:phosphoribosyl 1,2-cyclic phosphate phosphodiesterase